MDKDQLHQLEGLIDAIQIAVDSGANRDITTRALICVSDYIETFINTSSTTAE